MTEKAAPPSRRTGDSDRSERLAIALRANLRRRKLQARARSAASKADVQRDRDPGQSKV
jgi:hypothetical protein